MGLLRAARAPTDIMLQTVTCLIVTMCEPGAHHAARATPHPLSNVPARHCHLQLCAVCSHARAASSSARVLQHASCARTVPLDALHHLTSYQHLAHLFQGKQDEPGYARTPSAILQLQQAHAAHDSPMKAMQTANASMRPPAPSCKACACRARVGGAVQSFTPAIGRCGRLQDSPFSTHMSRMHMLQR